MSSEDVGPAGRCSVDGCSRAGVDPMHRAPRCEEHLPGSDESATDGATNEESGSPASNPTLDADVSRSTGSAGKDALADGLKWFHRQLNTEIEDHTPTGEHPDRPTTAREWFEDVRGFESETVDEKLLGWAPPYCSDQLIAHLHRQGHSREAILASGLFTEREDGTISANFSGRYVFPYFDSAGEPAYAIARCTGSKGGREYDGHPGDFQAGKYAKLSHTKDYVDVDEPIYGLPSLDRDGPVLITEGVADAIRAHEAGYACLSPVTTQFKNRHLDPLLEHLGDADRPVYIVQDSEPAPIDYTEDAEGWDALAIEQFGAGLKGGIRTAATLRSEGVDAYLAELPRMAEEKVDLDDYLGEWSDTLAPVLAAAQPAEEHDAYAAATSGSTQATRQQGTDTDATQRRQDSGESSTDELPDIDLEQGDVVEALSHVNPSLHYDDYVQLAYAVHDWGPCDRGKAVFERWARQSPKWEEPTSQDVIDWVWRNAATSPALQDSNVEATTVATLIHRAIEDGEYSPDWSYDDAEHTAVAPLALAKLDAVADHERERVVQKHDAEIPSTDGAREELRDMILREMRNGNRTVIDAPTALGKSYAVATEPWLRRADITGEAPVVHFHATTDARDEAAAQSENTVSHAVLKGRKERCPVAGGEFDPVTDEDEDEPEQIITINGEPASEWFDRQCDDKGLPFSTAHALAHERNDQGLEHLPCTEDGECEAIAQWNGLPRDDNGEPAVDVIHATHQFARVPSLRRYTNVVLDEQPDFSVDLSESGTVEHETARVRSIVNAYLQEIDAPTTTWEAFASLARLGNGGGDSDAHRLRDALDDVIGSEPRTEWFIEDPNAHALAPALTEAIWNALRWNDPDANGRRRETVMHKPPRLDVDGEAYASTHLTVVIDEENDIRTVRSTPNFSQSHAVIGLDAHPSMPLWQVNTREDMVSDAVLESEERRLWRRYERGLTVVQVGDATRPRSGSNARDWLNDDRVRAVVERLRDHYGGDFQTAITTSQVEHPVREILREFDAEITDDETMHYGEEKSRNDFADEDAGLLYGCMDPGDEMILDTLAELGYDASPARVSEDDVDDPVDAHCPDCGGDGCPDCNETGLKRAKGRDFEGDDADTAEAVLASVRENHVAQAAGRYARNPDDPDSQAVVFAMTDAMPTGFVDAKTPGVEWIATDLQRQIIDELAAQPSATAKEIADTVDCSKRHVLETLETLEENDLVARHESAGHQGADIYHIEDDKAATVDLGFSQVTNGRLLDYSRWSLVTWTPTSHGSSVKRGGSSRATVGATNSDGPPPG